MPLIQSLYRQQRNEEILSPTNKNLFMNKEKTSITSPFTNSLSKKEEENLQEEETHEVSTTGIFHIERNDQRKNVKKTMEADKTNFVLPKSQITQRLKQITQHEKSPIDSIKSKDNFEVLNNIADFFLKFTRGNLQEQATKTLEKMEIDKSELVHRIVQLDNFHQWYQDLLPRLEKVKPLHKKLISFVDKRVFKHVKVLVSRPDTLVVDKNLAKEVCHILGNIESLYSQLYGAKSLLLERKKCTLFRKENYDEELPEELTKKLARNKKIILAICDKKFHERLEEKFINPVEQDLKHVFNFFEAMSLYLDKMHNFMVYIKTHILCAINEQKSQEFQNQNNTTVKLYNIGLNIHSKYRFLLEKTHDINSVPSSIRNSPLSYQDIEQYFTRFEIPSYKKVDPQIFETYKIAQGQAEWALSRLTQLLIT